jgi:hypothetical protein
MKMNTSSSNNSSNHNTTSNVEGLEVLRTGVLPVLSGERSDNFPEAFKVDTNQVYWNYLVRDKKKFLLTNPKTCLVEETTCKAKDPSKDKASGKAADQGAGQGADVLKGWKTLVSDHYPVYVDLQM